MTCAECQDLLLDLAYGELEPPHAAEVAAHAAGCASCGPELARLQGTRRLVSPLTATEEPSAGFDERLLSAARAASAPAHAVAAAAASSAWGPASSAAPDAATARMRRRGRWMRAAVVASFAAAAGLAVVVSTNLTGRAPREEYAPPAAQVAAGQSARRERAATEERAPDLKQAVEAKEAQRAAEVARLDAPLEPADDAPKAAAPPRQRKQAELSAPLEPAPVGVQEQPKAAPPKLAAGHGEALAKKKASLPAARETDGTVALDVLVDDAGGPGGAASDSRQRKARAGGASGVAAKGLNDLGGTGGGGAGVAVSGSAGSRGLIGTSTQSIAAITPAKAAHGGAGKDVGSAERSEGLGVGLPGTPASAPPPAAKSARPPAAMAAPAPIATALSGALESSAPPPATAPEDAEGLERRAAATADHPFAANLWRRAAALRRDVGDIEGAARDLARAVDQLAAAGRLADAQDVQRELEALSPAQTAAVAEGQRAVERARGKRSKAAPKADQPAPAGQQVEF